MRASIPPVLLFAAFLLTSGRALAENAAPTTPASTMKICGPEALGTSRTLTLGTKGGFAVGEKSYPATLALADHEVVLTFDDGPGATTPAVLDALARECVEANFFLVGRKAEARPDLVRRELAEGHTLGHHSYSHPARTLRRMSEAAAEADILNGFKADDLAAYGVAGDLPRVPFFRFPGFADTPVLDAWLANRNIGIFGTDIWALDWLMLTPEAELDFLMRRLGETHTGIILLHDTRASTARMMPMLLRALKVGGYHIVHVVPGLGPAATVPAPTGWHSETDRIIAEVFKRERTGGGRVSRHHGLSRRWVAIHDVGDRPRDTRQLEARPSNIWHHRMGSKARSARRP